MGFMNIAGGFAEGFGKSFSSAFDTSRQLEARKKEKEKDFENDKTLLGLKEAAETARELGKNENKQRGYIALGEQYAQSIGRPGLAKEFASMIMAANGDDTGVKSIIEKNDFSGPGVASEINTRSAGSAPSGPSSSNDITSAPLPAVGEPTNNRPKLSDEADPGWKPQTSLPDQTQGAFGYPPTAASSGTAPITPQASRPAGMQMGGYIMTPKAPDYNKTLDAARNKLIEAQRTGVGLDEARADLQRFGNVNQILNPRVGQTAVDVQRQLVEALRNNDQEGAAQARQILNQSVQAELDAKRLSAGPQPVVTVDPATNKSKLVMGTPQQTQDGIVFTDSNGQILDGARLRTEDEVKEITRIKQKYANNVEVRNQNIAVQGATGTVRSIQRLSQMIDQDPGVLSNRVAPIAQLVEGAFDEVRTAGRLLGVEVESNDNGAISTQSLDSLQKKLDSVDINAVEDIAQRKSLFEAEKMILAYRAGRAEGQSGPSFTKDDYNKITESIFTDSNKPDVVKQAMYNYGNGIIKTVDDMGKLISRDPDMKDFEDLYGYSPTREVVPTVAQLVSDTGDEQDQQTYNMIMSQGGKLLKNTEHGDPQARQQNAQPTSVINPKAADYLKAHPELRDQFDAKFGKGAAASVLGQ